MVHGLIAKNGLAYRIFGLEKKKIGWYIQPINRAEKGIFFHLFLTFIIKRLADFAWQFGHS